MVFSESLTKSSLLLVPSVNALWNPGRCALLGTLLQSRKQATQAPPERMLMITSSPSNQLSSPLPDRVKLHLWMRERVGVSFMEALHSLKRRFSESHSITMVRPSCSNPSRALHGKQSQRCGTSLGCALGLAGAAFNAARSTSIAPRRPLPSSSTKTRTLRLSFGTLITSEIRVTSRFSRLGS